MSLFLTLSLSGCGSKKDDTKKATPATNPTETSSAPTAHCFSMDPKGGPIEGDNIDHLQPLASVSKVMTSYWAIKKLGGNARFETQIHIRTVPGRENVYDLHLEGSRDPYSNQAMFQLMIGKLNNLGIKQVRKLSFDENLKFKRDLRSRSAATATIGNAEPTPATVKSQLDNMLVSLSADYEFLRLKAATMGHQLPEKLELTVEKVDHIKKADFKPRQYSKKAIYKTTQLTRILKEMNRNSNNMAATQVFESLGGSIGFQNFISEALGLSETQLKFVNGSGNRIDIQGNANYNMGTCRAVMTLMQALKLELEKQSLSIEQVLPVAGRFDPSEEVGNFNVYQNNKTEGVLIAKTGTVGPAVTLGGLFASDLGPIYFAYTQKTTESNSIWERARILIRDHLFKSIEGKKSAPPSTFIPKPFLEFDETSWIGPN